MERALLADAPVDAVPEPATAVVYRDRRGTGVRTLGANAATVAVLLAESRPGVPLPGVLAELSPEALGAERERLVRAGVL